MTVNGNGKRKLAEFKLFDRFAAKLWKCNNFTALYAF